MQEVGADDAFEAAVAQVRPQLVARAREALAGNGEDPNDAEDLVQETLIRALTIRQRPPISWPAWFRGILANVLREHFRRRRLPGDEALDVVPVAVSNTGEHFTYASRKRFRGGPLTA